MATPFDSQNLPAAPMGGVLVAPAVEVGITPGQADYLRDLMMRKSKLLGMSDEQATAKVESWLPTLSKAGASKQIDAVNGWLDDYARTHAAPAELIDTDAPKSTGIVDPGAEVVPEGRYAVETEAGAVNRIAFYKVDRPTEGRWAGYVFVKLLVSDVEKRLSWKASSKVLAKIAEVGAGEASRAYGRESRKCGICGRKLTKDESRERGIGPECAERMGW